MPATSLPPEVQRFLAHNIPSVAHLEALLLLRSAPHRSWGAGELGESLYIDASRASAIAAHLIMRGLAVEDRRGEYRYAPSPALADAADQLAETYRSRLIAVSEFIHAEQDSTGMRAFADAFRLRRG